MKTILIKKDKSFVIPREHRITKENRTLRIKGEFFTSSERLLVGDMQTKIQNWFRQKSRKTHKGLIEINGIFYKIIPISDVKRNGGGE